MGYAILINFFDNQSGSHRGHCMAHVIRETLEREVKLRPVSGFQLPDFAGQCLHRRVFTSTYYDTKTYALGRLGITLRRRVEQKKGKWQLKLPRGTARLELEIAGDPVTLPAEFRDLLFALLRDEDVVPIAKLRTERLCFHVQQDSKTLAEITQDSVAVVDGRRIRRRMFEIEVELIEGNKNDLASIKEALQAAGALPTVSRPKVFQALDLAFPEFPPDVDPSARPIDHLKVMLQRQVREILLHDPGTRIGRDPEELHQMRVATRRFRALLHTGHAFLNPDWTKSLRSEAGWLGGSLGLVRDFDVLLDSLHHEISALTPQDQKVFPRLLSQLETQRSVSRASMLEALRSDRYVKLLDQLERAAQFPEGAATGFTLHEIAARQFKKLRSCGEKFTQNGSDEDLHRLRIRAKRARYAAELAERSVGKRATRFVSQIKKFQDALGSHQDAVMTEERLRGLLRSSHSVRTAFAVGQIVERLGTRKKRIRESIPKRWTKLKKRGKDAWIVS